MSDEKNETHVVVVGTGAGNMRALSGEHGPAVVTDNVAKEPDLSGPYGRAWLCDRAAGLKLLGIRDDQDAALAHWIIEAPYAHPVWHSYSIVLVHLHPMSDNRETIFHLKGATHEMWVYALNPEASRNTLIGTGIVDKNWLFPGNFAAQFIEITDELAVERIKRTVQSICDGQLSPDTDHQRAWEALFGNNMTKQAWR